MQKAGAPALWVTAVFGTWMVFLVPLIIVMYNKVDKAYEDARITRETSTFEKTKNQFNIRSVLIDESKRQLNPGLSKKLLYKFPKSNCLRQYLREFDFALNYQHYCR